MKLNKYGCSPKEDVCLAHDNPLLGFGFCEDSSVIKLFVEKKLKEEREQIIKVINRLEDFEFLDLYSKPDEDLVFKNDVIKVINSRN